MSMTTLLICALCALACTLLMLLPWALKHRPAQSSSRDVAWRDRLPPILRMLYPLVRWYASGTDKGLLPFKREVLQTRLNAAGASYLITPAEFMVIRRVACLLGFLLAGYILFALNVRSPVYIALTATLIPFSYMYPDIWLRDATKRRRARFEKEFPFFLDVLVLGMKAGLTFTAAVEQAMEQLRQGPVKEEFSRYLREMRTGVARRVALDRMASRVVIPAVANFAASVIQAEETGGSLGDVLADQARQRRQERFLRAEKLANQAPVKMLFPLIALLFPITFIIIGFPIVMQLIDSGAFKLL
jgi:tight adherence protein C